MATLPLDAKLERGAGPRWTGKPSVGALEVMFNKTRRPMLLRAPPTARLLTRTYQYRGYLIFSPLLQHTTNDTCRAFSPTGRVYSTPHGLSPHMRVRSVRTAEPNPACSSNHGHNGPIGDLPLLAPKLQEGGILEHAQGSLSSPNRRSVMHTFHRDVTCSLTLSNAEILINTALALVAARPHASRLAISRRRHQPCLSSRSLLPASRQRFMAFVVQFFALLLKTIL